MKQVFEKNIPKKNYIIVLVVSILVICIALYTRTIYLNGKDNILDKSIFEKENSVIGVINVDDLDFVVSEANDIVIFISYNGDSQIKNMEKKLYRDIVKHDYVDKVLYLNVSEYKDNKAYINILKEKFSNVKDNISDAPIMIYIKEGEPIEAVNSEFKMVDFSVLEKLFEKYEISTKIKIDY
jgi:hypothetical protein